MSKIALALLLLPAVAGAQDSRATVRDYGECADVSAPTCSVRDFWPRALRVEATGQSVYWLASTDGRVCFVEQRRYAEASPGREATCIWRYRQP